MAQAHIVVNPPAAARQHERPKYRDRGVDELEECTWLVGSSEYAPTRKVRLSSVKSKQETCIEFVNTLDISVTPMWIDFNGHEAMYSEIGPNSKKRYLTYVSHPWIIRDVRSGQRMMVGQRQVVHATQEDMVVKITMPPKLDWNFATHHYYPADFKRSTKAALLAFNRASNMQYELEALGSKARIKRLPHDLVLQIIKFMAPTDQLQDITKGPKAHPDILPALLPCDPATGPAPAGSPMATL